MTRTLLDDGLGSLAALAQQGGAGGALWRSMGYALLLLVAGVTAFVVIMWVRRQILGQGEATPDDLGGFSLAELRRLRDAGKISTEEYERARQGLLEVSQRHFGSPAEADKAPPATGPRSKDTDLIRDME